MAEEFLSDSTGSGCPNSESETPERKPVRVLLIGSREGVIETIHTLYQKDFAEVGAWSPLQPTKNPGEVMSILTRHSKGQSNDTGTRKSGR